MAASGSMGIALPQAATGLDAPTCSGQMNDLLMISSLVGGPNLPFEPLLTPISLAGDHQHLQATTTIPSLCRPPQPPSVVSMTPTDQLFRRPVPTNVTAVATVLNNLSSGFKEICQLLTVEITYLQHLPLWTTSAHCRSFVCLYLCPAWTTQTWTVLELDICVRQLRGGI
jgi:hypothetical protein